MENNFIQMGALAGHAVAYMIGLIFKHRLCVNYRLCAAVFMASRILSLTASIVSGLSA